MVCLGLEPGQQEVGAYETTELWLCHPQTCYNVEILKKLQTKAQK